MVLKMAHFHKSTGHNEAYDIVTQYFEIIIKSK